MGKCKARSDVILKTIFRIMRKSLIDDFNNQTKFMDKKRYKPDTYLIDSLIVYIRSMKVESSLKSSFKESEDGLVFVLGSLFYPKIIKTLPQY
jgi:hypothetical protein